MRRIVAVLAVVVFAAGFVGPIAADEATVKGEVIDVMCHAKDAKQVGAAHVKCATSCASKGGAMGILTGDAVYTITGEYTKENNKKLIEFVGKQVEAKGAVTEKDGAKLIEAASIAAAK